MNLLEIIIYKILTLRQKKHYQYMYQDNNFRLNKKMNNKNKSTNRFNNHLGKKLRMMKKKCTGFLFNKILSKILKISFFQNKRKDLNQLRSKFKKKAKQFILKKNYQINFQQENCCIICQYFFKSIDYIDIVI